MGRKCLREAQAPARVALIMRFEIALEVSPLDTDTNAIATQIRAPAEGTDHVCDTCGCEIMVKHSGDHTLHTSDHYICRCGTPMRLELTP